MPRQAPIGLTLLVTGVSTGLPSRTFLTNRLTVGNASLDGSVHRFALIIHPYRIFEIPVFLTAKRPMAACNAIALKPSRRVGVDVPCHLLHLKGLPDKICRAV